MELVKKKQSHADPIAITQRTFDENMDAVRVVLVDGNMPEFTQTESRIQIIEVPTIIIEKEVRIVEIEKIVIEREIELVEVPRIITEYKTIEIPVFHTKTEVQIIEKPIYIEKVQYKEIPMFIKIAILATPLIFLVALVKHII